MASTNLSVATFAALTTPPATSAPADTRGAQLLTLMRHATACGTPIAHLGEVELREVCSAPGCGAPVPYGADGPCCAGAKIVTVEVVVPARERTQYRLYRRAGDGDRTSFSTATDREIPIVDGVTVFVSSRDELAEVIHLASEGGLDVAHAVPGDRERAAGAMFRCVIRTAVAS